MFPLLLSEEKVHPIIRFFGKAYPAYGSFMVFGAITALFTGLFLTRKKHKFDYFDFVLNFLWIFVGAMIGSKLLYVIVEIKAITEQPKLLLNILQAGGVFYGGLIGIFISCFISCRIRKWNYLKMADTLVGPGALAHSFGRVGCFLGGCCYGCETDSIFGVYFPEGGLAPSGVKLLPTQLFEAIFLFILAIVLILILFLSKRAGITTGVYMTAYAIWRFIIEFFRSDRRGSVGTLTTSQFISIFIFIMGLAFLIFNRQLTDLFEKIKNLPTLKERKQAKNQ